MKIKSDVKMPGTIKPPNAPRSKTWHDTYHNVIARGGTEEQARGMADAVYRAWRPKKNREEEDAAIRRTIEHVNTPGRSITPPWDPESTDW